MKRKKEKAIIVDPVGETMLNNAPSITSRSKDFINSNEIIDV
jgi:hypothetical protein